MLFIKIEQYGWDVSLFGQEPKKDSHLSFYGNRLYLNDTGWVCDYQRFEHLPKMYGNSFESVEVMGKRLVGYVRCPYWAHSKEPIHGDVDLPQLLIHYVNNKVETDFETWLRQNPLIRKRNERTHMGIFLTYEGVVVLMYLEKGKVHFERIIENAFVYEGHITTLAEVKEKQLEAARQQVRDVEAFHAKLDEKYVDLPSTLNNKDLAHFIKTR